MAKPPKTISEAKFANLMNFYVGLYYFLLYTDQNEDSSVKSHSQTGKGILRRNMSEFQLGIRTYLGNYADSINKGVFLDRATDPKAVDTHLQVTIRFLKLTLKRLSAQSGKMREIFPGIVFRMVNQTSQALSVSEDTPGEAVFLCASNNGKGRQPLTLKWLREAAKLVKAPLTDLEEAVQDVTVAQDLGRELQDLDTQIAFTDPETEKSNQLQGRKAKVIETVEALSSTSIVPDEVFNAAVSSAAPSQAHPNNRSATGAKLGLNEEQEDAMLEGGKVLIDAGAGSGKCIRGDSLIQTDKGFVEIQSLGDLEPNQDIPLSLWVNGNKGPEITSHLYRNGISKTRKIETRNGYFLEGTPNHKIFILREGKVSWVKLQDIEEEDFACIDRRPGFFSETLFIRSNKVTGLPVELTPEIATLLGYIISEGYVRKTTFEISMGTSDPAQLLLLKKNLSNLNINYRESLDERKITPNRKPWTSLSFYKTSEIKSLMEFGLTRVSAHEKEIPYGVLASPKKVIVQFLRSLFDGDGGVEQNTISYCTASSKLAHQLQVLLLSFGIISRKKFRPNKRKGAYHIYITGNAARVFAEEIGFNLSEKTRKVEELIARKSNTNVDVIPKIGYLCQNIKTLYKAKTGLAHTEHPSYGVFKDYCKSRRCPSFPFLREFLDLYKTNCSDWDTLDQLVSSKWFFDPIYHIEEGEEDTYDFVVPGTHSFSGNGFINHNTRVLAGKVTYLINEKGIPSHNIIATSFSKKSAREFQDRILKYGSETVLDSGAQGIGTTHSISLKLIREFAPTLASRGILGDKGGVSQDLVLTMAMKQVQMKTESKPQDPPIKGFFDGLVDSISNQEIVVPGQEVEQADSLLEDNLEIKQFQLALDSTINTLNDNIREYGDSGWQGSALRSAQKFKRMKPEELSAQEKAVFNKITGLDKSRKWFQRQLSRAFNQAGIPKMNKLASEYKVAVKKKERSRFWKESANEWFNLGIKDLGVSKKEAGTYISKLKGNLITPSESWKDRPGSPEAAIYGAYEWLKANDLSLGRKMDFDDMLVETCKILVGNRRARETLQERFKYIIVDEAQDQNKAQNVLFGIIAGYLDPATRLPYGDGRMTAKDFTFCGDSDQCIEIGTLVDTPTGQVKAGDLKTGDEVLSYRNQKIVPQIVKHVMTSSWDKGVRIHTKSGRSLLMSPNHKIWASDLVTVGSEMVVYLMYRKDLGFRVGVTNKGKVYRNKRGSFGLRTVSEKAEKFWVLEVCPNREEALLRETTYSLKYGIPTCVFNGIGRNLNQDRINAVFEEFGQNGLSLLKEKHLNFDLPHWVPQSNSLGQRKRLLINLNAHTNRGTQVSFEWTGEGLKESLKDLTISSKGHVYTKSKKGGYRIRRSFNSYRDALGFALDLSNASGANLSKKLSTPFGTLRLLTASSLFSGMKVISLDKGRVIYDPIVSITEEKGVFIDLDVDDASNFFGNEILSSNSIYAFRGAVPKEFIDRSDLLGGEFKTKLLETNYRSGEAIVNAGQKLISHNKGRIPKVCHAFTEKNGMGVINSLSVFNHEEGAAHTIERIDELKEQFGFVGADGKPNFGIVVRTNAEAFAFVTECLKKELPFRSKINVFANKTTKALLSWINLANASNTERNVINASVLTAHNTPGFMLDAYFEKRLQELASGYSHNVNYLDILKRESQNIYTGKSSWRNRNVSDYLDTLEEVFKFEGSPSDILSQIMDLKGVGFRERPAMSMKESLVSELEKDTEAMARINEQTNNEPTQGDLEAEAFAPISLLLTLAANYEDTGPFVAYISELQDVNKRKHKKDDPSAEDYEDPAVIIDTAHGWKGLEAHHIYVPMTGGTFPHISAEGDPEALEEERRLAYVAITRGQESVTIISPEKGLNGKEVLPSRFIAEACISPMGVESVTQELDVDRIEKTASFLYDSILLSEDGYVDPGEALRDSWDFLG